MKNEIVYINDTDLTERNFLLYAAKKYENPQCHDMEEFYNDLLITIHLKKLFTRYHVNGVLKDRLIINHIISFFNVFEPRAAVKILFFKLDAPYHSYLKTVLIYLGRCPDSTMVINGKLLNIKNIPINQALFNALGKTEALEEA